MAKKTQKASAASGKVSDPRFASFETDPRFRLPSSKKTKTTLDKRFSRMLKDDEFTSSAKVDKYGRKLKSDAGKKALNNLYRKEDEDEDEEDEGESQEHDEGKAESSDEEEDSEEELDTGRKYDPARDGGFSSSESESDDDEEIEVEDDNDPSGSMQRFADEQTQVEEGEVTNRIAIVNLDWDHIKSQDLLALFTSFVPENSGGKVEKVSVYPSEFGKERMQREEVEGPPPELFKNSKSRKDVAFEDEDSEDEDSDAADEKIKQELLREENDKDFDGDALRAYQLDRLRYYYAVMVCSDNDTAQAIYEATDGTEYLSSSNFIDLRFVPDDVTFDDEPRDECAEVPQGYEPVEFVTGALQSSKVKLTWDMHPEEASRKQNMRKAFSGSRDDIQENDLRAYLASDTEDEADDMNMEEGPDGEAEGEAGEKLSKKELARRKMREALGFGAEPSAKRSKDEPVGDMQITFTSALLPKSNDTNKDEAEETTIEKYARKERERKQMRKEKALAKRAGEDAGAAKDAAAAASDAGDKEDLGFDDPFFMAADEPAPASKGQGKLRKEERKKKREAKEAETAEKAAEKAHLQRLMDEGAEEAGMDRFKHFDMKDIKKAEKDKTKKAKYRKNKGADGADAGVNLQEGQELALDDRFRPMFESHEYAVDTSNPMYTRTETMQKFLDEGRKKKRKDRDGDGEREERGGEKKKKKARKDGSGEADLNELVASVKEKAKKKSRV